MSTKYTPGPWYTATQNDALFVVAGKPPATSNDYPEHDADRVPVCRIIQGELAFNTSCTNARLIAAAPELLLVCKALLDWIKQSGNAEFISGEDMVSAEEAIAKAEGSNE
jgi:hypothetical protein